MKLREALNKGIIKLNQKEKKCLQELLEQQYIEFEYYELGKLSKGEEIGLANELETKCLKSAILSLYKKNIVNLEVNEIENSIIRVYTNYELEFEGDIYFPKIKFE